MAVLIANAGLFAVSLGSFAFIVCGAEGYSRWWCVVPLLYTAVFAQAVANEAAAMAQAGAQPRRTRRDEL